MDKPVNFQSFLKNTVKIKIPRIQRDYVQGGHDQKASDIRSCFLSDFKNAWLGNKKLSLDFIYGVNEKNQFYPLDGQQRLTTLFLLFWYGAVKNENQKILEYLKKFSYQTRLSSEAFCKLLLCDSVIRRAGTTRKDFITAITEDPGYSKFWKYDPTVDSMLNMLKEIDKEFNDANITDIEQKWAEFFREDNDAVTFFKHEIGNSQEPDDLYVKMNARGKHLTHFENFKARLQQWMKNNNELDDAFQTEWRRKMDAQWSEFFWKSEADNQDFHFDNNPDPAQALIDRPFWIFLNRISLYAYFHNNPQILTALRQKTDNENTEDPNVIEGRDYVNSLRLGDLEKNSDYVSPQKHKTIFNPESKEAQFFSYKLISDTLNVLEEISIVNKGNELFPKWNCQDKKYANFFWSNKAGYSDLFMIWAFAGYCNKFSVYPKKDLENIRNWMQFCSQIAEEINDIQSLANAVAMEMLCLTKMLECDQKNIYQFLHDRYANAVNNANYNRNENLSWHEAPLKWHQNQSPYRIYNILFDQSIPVPGINDNEERILFQADTIFMEAFKAYLKLEDDRWNEIFEKLETSDQFRGCVHGFVSPNDPADKLYDYAKSRLDNFPCRFNNSDSSVFIDLVKALPSENISLTFSLHTHKLWKSQVVKNKTRNVAEAVSRILLQEEELAFPEDGWRKLLVESSELITDADWGVGSDKNTLAHRIQPYKGGKMYIFKKSYINSGAIVLEQLIHEGMKRLEDLELFIHRPKFKEFYICEVPGINDGIFGTKVIEENRVRIIVSANNISKEIFNGTEWGIAQCINWNDLQEKNDDELKSFFSET